MRNIYVYKNLPHFCPRKNGDSCRHVSGFHRLKRELHARMFIYILPPGLLRLFPCSLRVSFLSLSAGSPCGSCALPLLRFLFGAVFIVFPCPSLIVFSPFSLPLDAAFPRFICFPFVSRIAVACRGAVRYCFPPVSVSSPVSLFRAVGRGGGACSEGWGIAPWRGVAEMAGCPVVPLGGSFSTVCGTGRFGWFFHVEIIGRVCSLDGRGGGDGLFAAGRA